MLGVVQDVSQHGMGVGLPTDMPLSVGDLVMVVVEAVASYAITATVRRMEADGLVGLEFEDELEKAAVAKVEALPLADGFQLPTSDLGGHPD